MYLIFTKRALNGKYWIVAKNGKITKPEKLASY
jgi:hypothetical protein